jgi:hypothetical protein
MAVKRPDRKPRVKRSSSAQARARAKSQRPPFASGYKKRTSSPLTQGFVNSDIKRAKSSLTASRVLCMLLGLSIMFYSGIVIALLIVNERYPAAGYMALFFLLGFLIARGKLKENLKNIARNGSHRYDSYNS